MIDSARIQRLLDKDEIATALQRWAHAVGRSEWDQVRALFHDDAIDVHGTFDGGVDEFIRSQRRHHEGIELSVHFLSAVDIEFADADTALCQTYVTVYQRFGVAARQARADVLGPGAEAHAKPMNAILVGRYIDRFTRREQVWKVAHRLVAFEWNLVQDAPWELPFRSHWTTAQRDERDPIHAIRAEMGLRPRGEAT